MELETSRLNQPPEHQEFTYEHVQSFLDKTRSLLPEMELYIDPIAETADPTTAVDDKPKCTIMHLTATRLETPQYISEYRSDEDLYHALTVETIQVQTDPETKQTVHHKSTYQIHPDALFYWYHQTTRPVLTPRLETFTDDHAEEAQKNLILSTLAKICADTELGLNDFTLDRYEDVMSLLDQCAPENRIPAMR